MSFEGAEEPSTSAEANGKGFISGLRALGHRNYRIFLFGHTVSNIGTWIQSTALQWLVLTVLTNDSALKLGVFSFLAQLPILFLGLFAGALADSVNRFRIILWTQTLMMLYATALAALTLIHGGDGQPLISLGAVYLLALFSGTVMAFDLPARQAFLLQLVPKSDLPSAVALNSLTFNATRIIGPALAGLLVYYLRRLWPERVGFGEGVCFAINAVSFLAVLLSLLRLDKFPDPERPPAGQRLSYLVEGIRYVRRHPHLGALHVYVGIMAMFALPYLMLAPVYAREVLSGSARTFGYLNASIGAGAIIGGMLLVRRNQIRGLGKVIATTTTLFSLLIVALAWNPFGLAAACPLIGMAGFCMVISMISSQTLLQTLVAEDVRGRVISLYTMLNVGLMPFGSLLSGWLAERFGVGWALTINAGVCLATAVFFMLRLPQLRRAAHATAEWKQAAGEE